MAGERALPDLVSRIRVDSSGVDAAMSNLTASFGKANLAMAGVAAGIGLLIVGGKSMIDIATKHDQATRGLEQAYAVAGVSLTKYQRNIDDFIMSNRRYVSDQSEVITGYAKLTRSGLTQVEVEKDMSRAVDLSALKHITLGEAVDLVQKAEEGRMKGLIDLGITTSKFTDSQGNLIKANHSVAQAMDELDAKIKGGRQSLSEEEQAMNSMGISWQKFALGPGAELHRAMTNAVQIGDLFLQFLDKMGHDNPLWNAIEDKLLAMARWIHDYVIGPLTQASMWAGEHSGGILASQTNRPPGRATGGPVLPGGIYTVGENGPETLMMGPRGGGVVIPGGTTHYNLTLNGSAAVNDPEGVRRMLQRMALMGAGS